MQPSSQKRLLGPLILVGLLLLLDAAILGLAFYFRQDVVPGWKKGPLIDPAAPYAPENAIPLFAAVLVVMLDVYVAALYLGRRRRRVIVPILALLGGLLVAEGGVRLYLREAQVTYFRPHALLHWQVRPNLADFPNLTAPGTTVTTNADGMRGVDVPREKGADEYRILVLGDSSNFGQGVGGEETWTFQLERLLQGRMPGRSVHVLNGACPGWTTWQATQFLDTVGLRYGPDLVIAGFNNDPGPDYFGDKARLPPPAVVAAHRVLFHLETYLLAREFTLASVRRLFPAGEVPYTARRAGEKPAYGKLGEDEEKGLVPRVPLEDFLDNLRHLDRSARGAGASLAWINMPINRLVPELVDRYVNPEYRQAALALASESDFQYIDVEDRWARTREYGLHCDGHVFHPNAKGHLRMAQQIAAELAPALGLAGEFPIDGPPPARDAATLRFGYSSFTPVHAHVGAVLEAMPELAARYGLSLELHAYVSGGTQGDDVRSGLLDAFFTSGAPAVQMLRDRVDQRIVASPGDLGRVALLSRRARLEDLAGTSVGLTPASTAELAWRGWKAGLGASELSLRTAELEPVLLSGRAGAIVTWDPWAQDIARRNGLFVLKEEPFRSALSVSILWVLTEPSRGAHLISLIDEALRVAASDRPRWDAEVSRMSGWPVEVVRAVADRNDILAGRGGALAWTEKDRAWFSEALGSVGEGRLGYDGAVAPDLIAGKVPRPRATPQDAPRGPPPRGPGPGPGSKGPPKRAP